MRLRGIRSLLAGALLAACSEPRLAPPSDSTPAAVFDAVWREFDLHYSMFGLKGVDWDSVGGVYRPQAVAAPTDAALAGVISKMLMTLHDRHVYLSADGAQRPLAYLAPSDTAAPTFSASLIERRIAGLVSTAGGHVRYGAVSPAVGYLRVPTFEGDWASELDVAIAALADKRALVVDVRSNFGGNYATALDAAGRFADRPRTFGYVRIRNGPRHDDFTDLIAETVRPAGPGQFHGSVLVLTDRRVYSSAEDFVLAMRALPAVTVVGDTTAGATGKPIVRELPNGWTYQMSSWIEYTMERTPFEDIGLAPDVYVASVAHDALAGVDTVLERALGLAFTAASGQTNH